MRLLLVRHGKAEDRSDWSRLKRDENDRPLTEKGKKDFREVAIWIAKQVPDVRRIYASPLARTAQTAEILSEAVQKVGVTFANELRPEVDIEDRLRWVLSLSSEKKEDQVVALVGHEPYLSEIISWLVAGNERVSVNMRKGGVSFLTADSASKLGGFTLEWLVQPDQGGLSR